MLALAALQSWHAQVSLEFRQLALIFRIHCWMCDGICDESRRHHAFTASLSLTQLCRAMVGSAVCIAPSARNARVLTLGTGGIGASFPAHRHGCRSRQRTAAASIERVYSNCICQEEAEALHTCLWTLIFASFLHISVQSFKIWPLPCLCSSFHMLWARGVCY